METPEVSWDAVNYTIEITPEILDLVLVVLDNFSWESYLFERGLNELRKRDVSRNRLHNE